VPTTRETEGKAKSEASIIPAMQTHRFSLPVLLLFASISTAGSPIFAQTPLPSSASTSANTILHPADLDSLIPSTVYFQGQSATVQKRNSAGVRFNGGAVMFATKVDTGGYSSNIQERYQAYLITEVPLAIGGHRLPPGAYGVGFINNNKFVVMDIGGHDLFVADSQRDDAFPRPTPLQILPDSTPQSYRLYGGRAFVVFGRASEPGK
jgi:hypothetical protein